MIEGQGRILQSIMYIRQRKRQGLKVDNLYACLLLVCGYDHCRCAGSDAARICPGQIHFQKSGSRFLPVLLPTFTKKLW